MSDNKKYYYMKVKDNFFDTEEMVILESMPNGIAYQNLYLKLCLLSIKTEGALMFKNFMPYDINMLSTVLRVPIDTVKTGIELFIKMGLVEIADGQTFYMTDIQTMIGQSSSEADRIRDYRKKLSDKKAETKVIANDTSNIITGVITNDVTNVVTNVVQMYEKRTPEIEIEKELDKEIEKDILTQSDDCEEKEKKEKPKTQNRVVTDRYCAIYEEIFHKKFVPPRENYWIIIANRLKQVFKYYSLEDILTALDMAKNDSFILEKKYDLSLILSDGMMLRLSNPEYNKTNKATVSDKRKAGENFVDEDGIPF